MRETAGVTLTEFLLARIAEDERRWTNPAFVRLSGPWLSDLVLKMRAECEAKRRIVAKAQRANAAMDSGINPASAAAAFALTEVLHYLAEPYADHEDFQEEWRA